jgi:Fic family protein
VGRKKIERKERASKLLRTPLPTDPDEIARLEARNALRQFDAVVRLVDDALAGRHFLLRPSSILELNRLAIEDVVEQAGAYRTIPITISDSKHQPPIAKEVPFLVEGMCDYVNENWGKVAPVHLAAYLMWRTNWIHPFPDGNGRTSRALSYAVLCIRLGYRLPGTKTIPEQIAKDKFPYYDALESADKAWSSGRTDVSLLEELLSDALAAQLLYLHRLATGNITP